MYQHLTGAEWARNRSELYGLGELICIQKCKLKIYPLNCYVVLFFGEPHPTKPRTSELGQDGAIQVLSYHAFGYFLPPPPLCQQE